MFTRILQCNLKNNRIEDARQTLHSEVLPSLKKQPGLVDVVTSVEPETGEVCAITFWNTREDAERYAATEFNRINNRMREFYEDEPNVRILPVETSTIHNIARGKAAA